MSYSRIYRHHSTAPRHLQYRNHCNAAEYAGGYVLALAWLNAAIAAIPTDEDGVVRDGKLRERFARFCTQRDRLVKDMTSSEVHHKFPEDFGVDRLSATWHGNDGADIPAAACPRCGGWTNRGGMSHKADSRVPYNGRTGCVCHVS